MPRKPKKISLRKANLHPAEIAFLMDDESFLRPDLLRDEHALRCIREGGRGQLLFGKMTRNAEELLSEFGQEAFEIFHAAHPGELPSWWGMLSPEDQQSLR